MAKPNYQFQKRQKELKKKKKMEEKRQRKLEKGMAQSGENPEQDEAVDQTTGSDHSD